MSSAYCDQCKAPVMWYRSATTGKAMPIDPHPVEIGGNVYIEHGEAVVLKKGQTHAGPLFVTHFVTCPARTGRIPSADTKLVNPYDAVRRVRREIAEERETLRATTTNKATGANKVDSQAARRPQTETAPSTPGEVS